MCQFNLTGFNNTIDCPYIVEDIFLKIFKNNAIFDIYRDKLDENKYYYVLFVQVPAVVMVTVVVKNKVKIQSQSKSKLQPKSESNSKLESKYKYKSKLQSTLQSNHNLPSLI